MAEEVTIEQICNAFGRYYKSHNRGYEEYFTKYCDDNGFDEEMVAEEMQQDAEGCCLTDFADEDSYNFPFPESIDDKTKFVFELLQQIMNTPDVTFDLPIFECLLHNINNDIA